MGKVTIERCSGVAVLTMDNPPVNAIDHGIRVGLVEACADIVADSTIFAAVLVGSPRGFPSGSDIREFDWPIKEPILPEVLAAIEGCEKPIIAAISGQALGGGFELALACHYRLSDASASFGLPEVNLGLIPGAGGTLRLPRLVGLEAALEMITSGSSVLADDALAAGVLDEIVEGPVSLKAEQFARSLPVELPANRRLSSIETSGWTNAKVVLDQARSQVSRKRRGEIAPLAAIEVIQAGLSSSFLEGIKEERKVFNSLRGGEQSAAMRHIFFAERTCGKLPGITDNASFEMNDVLKVAVIGGGTMGCGIVLANLEAGFPVTLLEQSAAAAEAAFKRIDHQIQSLAVRGRLSDEHQNAWRSRLSITCHMEEISSADLVIEAVFEDLKIKSEILSRVGVILKPGAVMATNTSYLDVDRLAEASGRPEKFLGLHFFAPANLMKLLEIVLGSASNDSTVAMGFKYAKSLGKVGVPAGVCHGFIGNRMYRCYQQEAGRLLLEGASCSEVDAAITAWGFAMGPFTVADLSGLDIGYAMRRSLGAGQYDVNAFRVHDYLVESGALGRKSDSGFYLYGEQKGQQNAAVSFALDVAREALGLKPRTVGSDEIVGRCLLALYSEGRRILDEGIARSASDIDVVYVNGYGFPRWRGGPMYYGEIQSQMMKESL